MSDRRDFLKGAGGVALAAAGGTGQSQPTRRPAGDGRPALPTSW